MNSPRQDLAGTFDYVWQRFRRRMDGLGDAEWRWQPTADDRVTLAWRLRHIADLLSEDRNSAWLGVVGDDLPRPAPSTAGEALADVERGHEHLASLLRRTTEASLAEPIGAVAGGYGGATRFSFALHLLDEFIHHTAEAALLRDLYPG